jgi:hypothetical protein
MILMILSLIMVQAGINPARIPAIIRPITEPPMVAVSTVRLTSPNGESMGLNRKYG